MAIPELKHRPPWVRLTGWVPTADLAALYNGAAVVLAPSRGEGFDFPVAEVLACGGVVVASDIPAHRELFGGAVALFASGDADALAAAAGAAVGDSEHATDLRRRALERAPRFDWTTVARAHVALWREVARP